LLLNEYVLPPDEAAEMLDRLNRQLEDKRAKKIRLGIGIIGATVVALIGLTMGGDLPLDSLFPIWMVAVMFSGMIAVMVGFKPAQKLKRQDERVDFFRDLSERLRPDLHPKAVLRFSLDLRGAALAEKKIWSGRSPHGNPKAKYDDPWLRLSVELADRSRLSVLYREKVKTKSGSVMKTTHKLRIKLKPHPRVYDLPAARGRLRTLQVTPAGQGAEVRVSFSQLNSAYGPRGILRKVDAVLAELSPYRRSG